LSKILTYSRYLFDYLKHGDVVSIVASVKYVINKTSHRSDRIIQTSVGKFYCRKNTNDFQFANLYYEWGVKKFILDRKNEFSVFIDVGACVGDYSILLAKMNKQCFAFELVSHNIKTIKKNLELNDLYNKVKFFPYGLGDADYSASFSFDQIERIFIKLDVEGMETEAIRGAFNFIMYYPNITIIVEEKHSGQFPIKDTLSDIALFEFGRVDELNIYAKKIRNY